MNQVLDDNNIMNYKKAGVWALWGVNKVTNKRTCLEVAQTKNISSEVVSAKYILENDDDPRCVGCKCTYQARRRNNDYSECFQIHMCKTCEYESLFRIKSWKINPRYIDKYKDMVEKYEKFEFVLVSDDEKQMKDKASRRKTETEYAIKNKAVYWYS